MAQHAAAPALPPPDPGPKPGLAARVCAIILAPLLAELFAAIDRRIAALIAQLTAMIEAWRAGTLVPVPPTARAPRRPAPPTPRRPRATSWLDLLFADTPTPRFREPRCGEARFQPAAPAAPRPRLGGTSPRADRPRPHAPRPHAPRPHAPRPQFRRRPVRPAAAAQECRHPAAPRARHPHAPSLGPVRGPPPPRRFSGPRPAASSRA